MEAYHILIVEDDKEILDGVGIYMKNQGYEVFKAQNGLEGLKILEKEELKEKENGSLPYFDRRG